MPGSSETVTLRREIPVRREVDVFVAGGGPSGVAAALAAARQGSRVFLAEKGSCFGGMATAALVPAFYRLLSDGLHAQAGGIGEEVYRQLHARGGFGPGVDLDDPSLGFLPIRVEVLKRLYDDLVTAEAGLSFTFQTRLIGVEGEQDCALLAVCCAKSGLFGVRARVFVDATGDGDLAAMAGASYEQGDADGNVQPGTLCSLWHNIDWARVAEVNRPQSDRLEQAFNDGVLPVHDRHLPGIMRCGDDIGGGNVSHAFGVDGTDEASVTDALVQGRRLVGDYGRYYRKYIEGFEQMALIVTGSELGIRETRRITGDYMLGLEDFKRRAVFDDEIGRYSYPIDLHAVKPDADLYAAFLKEYEGMRYADGESYGIPYRVLVPVGLRNVLVAGRCVSADRFIQGSIRVASGCFITGQAAGVAASLAAAGTGAVRDISVPRLQEKLRAMGGFLPAPALSAGLG